jgi:hypothetical protein
MNSSVGGARRNPAEAWARPSGGIPPAPAGSSFPKAAPRPAGPPPEVAPGQRISHPVYGPGRITAINGPQAVIEFDLFGKKNVVLQYARLTLL